MMMRRRPNKLVWLIGIPVIAFGLAKWGMQYAVQKRLDQFILEASPRAGITYQTLETDLRGRIDVGGIKVIPVGQPEAITINWISLRGPDAITYMLGHNPVTGDPEALPDHLAFDVRGVVLDLNGKLAQKLDQQHQDEKAIQGMEMDLCGNRGGLSLELLKELGMETLNAELSGTYRYLEEKQTLKTDITLSLKGVEDLSMFAELTNVPAYAMRANRMLTPGIKRLEMDFRVEPRLGKDMSRYCANKRGMSVTEYEDQSADDFIRWVAANGVRLGPGLRSAIEDFYINWGKVEVAMSPPKPLNVMRLMFLPPEKMEETLGIQLIVNNRLITDLSFRLQKDAALFVRKDKKRKPPPPPKPRYKMVFKQVPPGSLGQYIYRDVQLKLRDQPMRSGVLKSASRGNLEVEQRLDGGKFTAYVPLKDVVAAKVRFRVRLNPPSPPKQSEPKQPATEQAQAAAE